MGINLNEMPKLGFGLMRLPENDGAIDLQQVNSMVDHYMKMEKHYFDTAYVYHGGNSEVAAREALVRRYPRDSVRTCVRQIRTAFARPHLRLTDQGSSIAHEAFLSLFKISRFLSISSHRSRTHSTLRPGSGGVLNI